MNTLANEPIPAPSPGVPSRHPNILVNNQAVIPGWVCDFETYRLWALSDDYPEAGWVSYIDGDIYVDMSMEELYTHNQVKGAYAHAILSVLGQNPPGMFVHDRMLLTNTAVKLSTEPDGLFFFWATVQSGRLRTIEGAEGFIELSGAADMVLEVVSKHSVQKDTVKLLESYWKAGFTEYWLVDARGPEPRFDIFRHTDKAYITTQPVDGWVTSSVFQRQFQLVQQLNPLGKPWFTVKSREIA